VTRRRLLTKAMNKWQVQYDEDFVTEVETYPEEVRIKITAMALVLEQFGPTLSRPKADTLKGSKYPNMKELRFAVGRQAWRVAYGFDPERKGILLVAGNKQGGNARQFYERLIRVADDRFDRHLDRLKR
jgi:hypothetical protein